MKNGIGRRLGAAWVLALLAACGGGGGGSPEPGAGAGGGGGGGAAAVSIGGAAWRASSAAGAAYVPAPDGTEVELVALSDGTSTTVARTTVVAGRYQFNNVTPAAGLSTRTLVRVLLSAQPLRAFATAATVDVSPVSEAVIGALGTSQQQGDGTLTEAEYSAMLAAAGTLAELARADAATPGTASVEQVALLLAADAPFNAYKAAAAAAGTTVAGIGDVGNLFPAEIGRRWQYFDTLRGVNSSGSVAPIAIAGQEVFGGRSDALKFVREDNGGPATYRAKDLTGVYGLGVAGGDAVSGAVLSAIGPLLQVPFPLVLGSTRQTINIANQALSTDLDGDGRPERLSATATNTVHGVESVSVLGEQRAAVKITNVLTARATLSSDASVGTLTITDIFWLVRGIGVVRSQSSVQVQHPLLNSAASSSLALLAWAGSSSNVLQFAGGEMRELTLAHEKLYPDLARGRVLATTFGADVTQGRALAAVDVDSGQVRSTSSLNVAVGALAVAPDGTIFVAAKPAAPDCQTLPEVIQLNATTLAEERRITVTRNPASFCAPGNIVRLDAPAVGTLLVQTQGSAGAELARFDNGVRAAGSLTSSNGQIFLSQPLVRVLTRGAEAYLVAAEGSISRSGYGTSGFVGPERTVGRFQGSPWNAWLDGELLRSGGESFDLASLSLRAGPAELMQCGPAEVPASPSLGACSVGLAYSLGRYRLHDIVTGLQTVELWLPWSPAIRSTAASRPTVLDARRFALSGAVGFTLGIEQYDRLYLVRRP